MDKRFYFPFLGILAVLLLPGCSGKEQVAGSGSQVGSLSAIIEDGNGTAAADVEVVMHPEQYNPALKKAGAGSDTVYTGQDGVFKITGLTPGTFTLVARDGKGNAVLMGEVEIPDTSLDYTLEIQELKTVGRVSGVVDLLAGGSPESTVVMIMGTDYFTSPDSAGAFSFSALPPGNLQVIVSGTSAGYGQKDSLVAVGSGSETDLGDLLLEERSDEFQRILSRFHFTYHRIWYTQDGEIDSIGVNNGNEEVWIRDGIDFFHNIDTVVLTGNSYYMRLFDADSQGAETGTVTRLWGEYDFTLGNICFKHSREQINNGDTASLPEQSVECYSWVNDGIEMDGCVSQIYYLDTLSLPVFYDIEIYYKVCDEVFPDKSHSDSSLALIDIWVRLD